MPSGIDGPKTVEPEQLALITSATVASTSCVLIACDFDGTLSPLVDDPAAAVVDPLALGALTTLSSLPRTAVAILSGRDFADLTQRVRASDTITLVGSHGAEISGRSSTLRQHQRATLDALCNTLTVISDMLPGSMVERKARGVAFHYRRADMKEAERLLPRVVDAAGHASDVHLRRGKCVLEFTLDTVTKGEAIVELRQIHMPTCTLYLGDDQTDEDAFAALTETDIGVKVGTGPTVAPYRLADVAQVTTFLSCLLAIRSNQAGASR